MLTNQLTIKGLENVNIVVRKKMRLSLHEPKCPQNPKNLKKCKQCDKIMEFKYLSLTKKRDYCSYTCSAASKKLSYDYV